jgi:hypothetical protein
VTNVASSDTSNQKPSFFEDGPENDDDDPILRQAEENRMNPRGAPSQHRPRVPVLPLSIQHMSIFSRYESDKDSAASHSDIESHGPLGVTADDSSQNTEKSWGKVIWSVILIVLAYLQFFVVRGTPWVLAFCQVMWSITWRTGCERGRYLSPEDISRLDVRESI